MHYITRQQGPDTTIIGFISGQVKTFEIILRIELVMRQA
jgi:hypothetical protein